MLLRLFSYLHNKINSICDCFKTNKTINNSNNCINNDDTNRQILDINPHLVINKEGVNRKLHDVEKKSNTNNDVIVDDSEKQNFIHNDSMPFIDFSKMFKVLTTITEEDEIYTADQTYKTINELVDQEAKVKIDDIKIINKFDCVDDNQIINTKNEIEKDNNIKRDLTHNIDILKINKSIENVEKFNIQNKR